MLCYSRSSAHFTQVYLNSGMYWSLRNSKYRRKIRLFIFVSDEKKQKYTDIQKYKNSIFALKVTFLVLTKFKLITWLKISYWVIVFIWRITLNVHVQRVCGANVLNLLKLFHKLIYIKILKSCNFNFTWNTFQYTQIL